MDEDTDEDDHSFNEPGTEEEEVNDPFRAWSVARQSKVGLAIRFIPVTIQSHHLGFRVII
jgi:hypothetical protein